MAERKKESQKLTFAEYPQYSLSFFAGVFIVIPILTGIIILILISYLSEPPIKFSPDPVADIDCCGHPNIAPQNASRSEHSEANTKEKEGAHSNHQSDGSYIQRTDIAAQRGM